MSQYIVSARKYRPDSFGTLIGQDNIAQTLKNSILRGQLAHAYLFCGPRGVGKTTTARIFAKMINCSDPTENMEPCGKCESCLSFAEGRSYCIHELDAASNNGVDDIKALMDQVRIPPQVGRYSVYIIDEVHMLSQSAFNAFLKTLEEPPAHAIFILATTEKHKILPTILSRCQTYDFNRITVENIVRNLRMVASGEGVTIDDESLHVIAHKADGAMRDALTIFDQTVAFCGTDVKYEDVLRNLNVLDYEYSFSLVDAFLAGDWSSALMTFDGILAKGFNALHFVAALSSHLRDLLVSKSGGLEALLELPESLKKKYMEQASRCPLQFLYEALGITAQCESGYRASVNPRLHIEFSLMRLSFLMNRQAGVQAAAQPVAVQPVAAQPAAVQQTSVQPASSRPVQAQQPAVQPSMVQPVPARQTVSQQTVAQQPTARQASEQQVSVQDAPVRPSAVQPAAAAPSVPEGQVPARDRRARSARPAASLSLKSMMEAAPEVAAAAAEDTPLPEDELLIEKWPELARQYEDKPRLASMLTTTTLTIEPSDSAKTVIFRVVNEAQKEWVESKLLHDLEGSYRKIVGSMKVYLRVSVTQDTVEHKKIYMPSEKAKELMSENDEVKNLVKDFGLDIK
ncbi:MAG: DNA polymerase III subunit gamma/tau [Bacteroidales bacterium]|nr:DNA polymerase III subunit gamma/tau [Bacteroidales bacterium]